MKSIFTVTTLIGLALAASAIGCSEAADEITNTRNCADVCERYQDCFDPDFDVSGCTDRCEDDADASESREARLERCENCIDDSSCAEGAVSCATECVGVIQ
jgi:hypothetical protein